MNSQKNQFYKRKRNKFSIWQRILRFMLMGKYKNHWQKSSFKKPFNSKKSSSKLYIGNLSYQSTEKDLAQLFSSYGITKSVQIIRDKRTNRSKGYAFIEMSNEKEAKEAIHFLHRNHFLGRDIIVSFAKPKADK